MESTIPISASTEEYYDTLNVRWTENIYLNVYLSIILVHASSSIIKSKVVCIYKMFRTSIS